MRKSITSKTHVILNVFLLSLLLIGLRVFYLTTAKYDHYLELSKKPARKVIIEKSNRGTIVDRDNTPLAINKIQYRACIVYNHIREIPKIKWIKTTKRKKEKIYFRKKYIEDLSSLLGQELNLDETDIEDIIYSKASIFPTTPFVIKDGISEETYYRLKMLERDWPGISAQRSSKRHYPQGKVGSSVIGYLGKISSYQHNRLAEELKMIKEFISKRENKEPIFLPKGFLTEEAVYQRRDALEKKAYTIHDLVGKSGIEAKYDDRLRGLFGKKTYEMAAKGHFIRELPGSIKAVSGDKLTLNISAKLQEFAEALLADNEKKRDQNFATLGKGHANIPSPWIKGGSIVAMNPQTGEVYALASFPRFDPNDFILSGSETEITQKKDNINKWLENSTYIANIWNGKTNLEREFYSDKKSFYTQEKPLSWGAFLDTILSKKSAVKHVLFEIDTIEKVISILNILDALIDITQEPRIDCLINHLYPKGSGHITIEQISNIDQMQKIDQLLEENNFITDPLKLSLDLYLKRIKNNYDKLLFLDLLRLNVDHTRFSEVLKESLPPFSMDEYFKLCQAFTCFEKSLKAYLKQSFHEISFPPWRDAHFKTYLKEKRELEKERKTYQRPYTNYLKEAERKLFDQFYQLNKWDIISSLFSDTRCAPSLDKYQKSLDQYLSEIEQDPSHCLHHKLHFLRQSFKQFENSDHAEQFLQTMRSFEDLNRPLLGRYLQIPSFLKKPLEKDLAKAFYPRFGYGYLKSYAYQQSTTLGSIFKVVTGYEALCQEGKEPPFLNPLTIYDEAQFLNTPNPIYGTFLSGKPIPRRYQGGRLPKSYRNFGKVDFHKAYEKSSNLYFSLLAGSFKDPIDLKRASLEFGFGKRTDLDLPYEISGMLPNDLRENKTGLYSFAIGQHSFTATPIQAAVMLSTFANQGVILKPSVLKQSQPIIKETIPIHIPYRDYVFEGLKKTCWNQEGSAHPHRIKDFYGKYSLMRKALSLKNLVIGKTSTSEIAYNPCLDRESKKILAKEIWFGAISYPDEESANVFANPELAVIVFLRFGDYGKEAASLAYQMIHKWKEIQTVK